MTAFWKAHRHQAQDGRRRPAWGVRPRRIVLMLVTGAIAVGATGLALHLAERRPGGAVAPPAGRINLIDPGTLTVCTHLPYRPLEYEEGTTVVGFDIDLVHLLAKRLGLVDKYQQTEFQLIPSGYALDIGRCDLATSGLTITPARQRVADYTAPYLIGGQALLVRAGAPYDSLPSLAGKRIGVQEGTTGEAYVLRHKPRGVEVISYDNLTAEEQGLTSRSIDAAVTDTPVCLDLAKRDPRFEVSARFNTGERYGLAVKKNGNPLLLRSANQWLAQIKRDGTWRRLYEKWFGAEPTTIP